MRFQFAADLRFTLAAIQDDEIFEESGLVVVEGLYFDRTTGPPARRQKPVTVRVRSRADVLHKRPLRVLGPTDDEGHDTSAVQQDQPADWSREDEVAFAILEIRVPPHLLRKREIAKQAAHDVRKHVDRRLASLANAVGEIGSPRGFRAVSYTHLRAH